MPDACTDKIMSQTPLRGKAPGRRSVSGKARGGRAFSGFSAQGSHTGEKSRERTRKKSFCRIRSAQRRKGQRVKKSPAERGGEAEVQSSMAERSIMETVCSI